MGIDYQMARRLIESRREGVSFKSCLTIGRQQVHWHPPERRLLRDLLEADGNSPGARFFRSDHEGEYADEFLKSVLLAESLEVLDASSYEGASIVHDLNEAVPERFDERFDAVIDGGSLEHVFHVPVALANLMRMTRVGGTIFLAVPANNLCGHGFYQFSPELMFRVFASENGFDLQHIRFFAAAYPSTELTSNLTAFDVVDPLSVGRRVGLMSKGAVMMIVQARRVAALPPFAKMPHQSDYVELWQPAQSDDPAPRPLHRRLMSCVYRSLPRWLRLRVNGYLQKRQYSFANRRFYRPVKPG